MICDGCDVSVTSTFVHILSAFLDVRAKMKPLNETNDNTCGDQRIASCSACVQVLIDFAIR